MDPVAATPAAQPVPSLLTPAGDGCPMCGAALAADQRYCTECGERRGEPRLPFMDGRTPPPAATPEAPAPQPAPQPAARRGIASTSTAVAAVATLVLSMGLGVLIGQSRDQGTTSAKTPAVQVLTVQGAGGAAGTAATPTDTTAAAATPTGTATTKTDKVATTATNAKTPAPSVKVPTKVVKIGSKGKGPGYKNGKFTGDFFGQ